MRRTSVLTVCAALVSAGIALMPIGPVEPAQAASTNHLHVLHVVGSGDYWLNYDMMSERYSSSNVDWPVTMIFTNNAEVNKVKNVLRDTGYFSSFPGSWNGMHNAVADDGTDDYHWDRDAGVKGSSCPRGSITQHARIYGGEGDRIYTPELNLGFYVLVTTHYDANECGGGTTWHGLSGMVEKSVAEYMDNRYSVNRDWLNVHNVEGKRFEGNHKWWNNRYATRVILP